MKAMELIGDYNIIEAVEYKSSYEVPSSQNSTTFKVDPSLELEVGDFVATTTVSKSDRFGNIFRVTKVYPKDLNLVTLDDSEFLWVIDKIDYSKLQARIDATKEHESILAQLGEKLKSFDDTKLLKLIAESDPEAQELLIKTEELTLSFSTKGYHFQEKSKEKDGKLN
jgi:hypothetical protein